MFFLSSKFGLLFTTLNTPLNEFHLSMIRGIMSQIDIVKGLRVVNEKIEVACKRRAKELQKFGTPRLVAVSKTKPCEFIIAAYNAGQRHFGENYVKELTEKARDAEITKQCPEIRWHFIGHLQGNKVKKVVHIPNLYMVETVDSVKIAEAINTAWQNSGPDTDKLKVMIQVNTSREKEKNGCTPEEAPELTKFVVDNCKSLDVIGLMTIGKYDYDTSLGPNPDFLCLLHVREEVCKYLNISVDKLELSMGMTADYEQATLIQVREDVAKTLNVPIDNLELSMGMSDDFEQAIELGSTSVRVGSAIFGHRDKKTSAKAEDEISDQMKQVHT